MRNGSGTDAERKRNGSGTEAQRSDRTERPPSEKRRSGSATRGGSASLRRDAVGAEPRPVLSEVVGLEELLFWHRPLPAGLANRRKGSFGSSRAWPRPLPVALSNRRNCLLEPAPSRWFYPIGETAFVSPPPPDGFIQLEELPLYPRPLPVALSNRKNCRFIPAPSRWFYPIGGTAVLSPPPPSGFIQ